jgi:hypothetical protein
MRKRPRCAKAKTLWMILLVCALWPIFDIDTAAPTTIVVVRTPTVIYIGADSRITDIRNESRTSTACKIRRAGDLFYAFSGFPRIPGVKPGLMEIIQVAAEGGGSITEMVEAFDDTIADTWSGGLQKLKQKHPKFYKEEIRDRNLLQIAIAGIQNRKPVFFMRHLKAMERNGSPGIDIYKKSCPGDCQKGKVIACLGHIGALEGYTSVRSDVWKDGYVRGIRRLITLQMDASPEHVGPPIDILQIRRQGARWIQIKPECPEIE